MAAYTTVADLDLSRIAARYGLSGLTAAPMAGGMANSSFRVSSEQGQTYVLTVLDNHDVASAERLALRTEAMHGLGVPTSRLVRTVDGSWGGSTVGRPFILKEWISGDVHRELPFACLAPAGALLAAVHCLPADGLHLPTGTRHLSEDHLSLIPSFPDQEFAHWLSARLEVVLSGAGVISGQDGTVIHGDFTASNLVLGRHISVIDWETATWDDPLLDIGMALVSVARIGTRYDQERAAAFLTGYRESGGGNGMRDRDVLAAVEHAALILAFHRYNRHHLRFPDPSKHHLYKEAVNFAEALKVSQR
ncbi:phosphotransferase [Streptomyces sp. NPDC002917]|uniref:phosphotransferase n=1 Tax=Streptomyces sp. NPDC002917 TaxID=3364671 RepID=UPI003678FB5D